MVRPEQRPTDPLAVPRPSPTPVPVDRSTLPAELETLAAVGESLFRRLADGAGRSLDETLTVVPFDDGVAVVRPVRGGGTIFVGPDGTVLYQGSSVGFARGVAAFRAGERTALDRF